MFPKQDGKKCSEKILDSCFVFVRKMWLPVARFSFHFDQNASQLSKYLLIGKIKTKKKLSIWVVLINYNFISLSWVWEKYAGKKPSGM